MFHAEHAIQPGITGPACGFLTLLQGSGVVALVQAKGWDLTAISLCLGASGTFLMACVAASRELRVWIRRDAK